MMGIAKNGFAAVLGALALTAFAVPASASLIGTTVDITSPHGNCIGVTVGAGAECSISDTVFEGDDFIDVNIEDSRIVFAFVNILDGGVGGSFLWSPEPFVFDVVIDGLTWVDDPSAAIAVSGAAFAFGGTAGNATPNTIRAFASGANQVTLNFGNLHRLDCGIGLCARLTLDLIPVPSVLPEPASMALFGFGLLGIGAALRRRRMPA